MSIHTEFEIECELSSEVTLKFKAVFNEEHSYSITVNGAGPYPLSDTDIHTLLEVITELDTVIHRKPL